MTTNVFKKVTVAVLALVAAVCLAFGFSVMPAAFADEELKTMTVTGVSGGAQDGMSRYLVYLEGDIPFEHDGNVGPITVSVNGEDKSIYLYNDAGDKKVALLVTYDIAPKEAENRVVVKKDTVIGEYKIAEDVTILLDNGNMSIVVPDVEYPIESISGGAQDFANRYLIWLESSVAFGSRNGIDPITVSVNGEDKTLEIYNAKDGSVALLVPFDVVPKESKAEVVVKKGTRLDNYVVTDDVTILLDNGNMSIVVPDVEYPIESIGGAAQENRYLIWLESSVKFESQNGIDPITVSVNGEDKTLEIYNAKDGSVALLVPFDVVPRESKAEVVVKKGTKLDNYVITKDVTIVLDNGEFYIKVPEIDFTIVDFDGGLQDFLNRYLVWFNGDVAFESSQSPDPIVVSVNGEDKTLELYNDKDGKALALLVPYEVAPKDGRTEITIKQGTKICNYVVKEEVTVILNRGTIKKKIPLTDISFSLQRDMLGDVTSCIQETGDLRRYLIRIQTDLDGLTDTMWNGNVCVLDEGTENEREININYLGGMNGKPDEEGYDGTAILAIIDYDSIVAGATVASEIGKHSITIRQGTELGGGYSVKEDFRFWIGNEYIAEDERDIPKLPAGVFKANKGLENKTVDFETQKIEDYIAGSSVVKLKANAEKDADGNVLLRSGDSAGYCKSLKMIGAQAEPQIKFRSTYNGGDVYLVMELRSTLDNGNFWLTEGAPMVRLRYNESKAESEELSECLWFDFFNDGLQGTPQFIIYHNTEFKLAKGDFFVEFGAVNKKDVQGNDGFVFFVKVTQGESVAYGECYMTGDYNVSDSGDVSIYISPAPTSLLLDYSDWATLDVKDSCIKSVDTEREIDGETRKIGAMSLYSPKIRRAENTDEYDISDIVPIGNGITYTKVEGDTESASQSMINATEVTNKNGGYSVKMKIKFTGADFGLTFAFRGKNTLAKSGYKLIIADDVVIIGSMTKASPFVQGTEYDIEIGCIDYFVADERVPAGTIVYLKVNGELVAEDNIEKMLGLGNYFCALIEGAGDSKVTITSAKAETERKAYELKTTANKTVVSNGKKTTLSYECNMKTAYDKVTYEVIKGDARVDGDGLYSNTDGEIVVRVKIENEFGTFLGEEITLNKGAAGESGNPTDSNTGKGGCGGGVAAGILPLAVVAIMAIAKKRREI